MTSPTDPFPGPDPTPDPTPDPMPSPMPGRPVPDPGPAPMPLPGPLPGPVPPLTPDLAGAARRVRPHRLGPVRRLRARREAARGTAELVRWLSGQC